MKKFSLIPISLLLVNVAFADKADSAVPEEQKITQSGEISQKADSTKGNPRNTAARPNEESVKPRRGDEGARRDGSSEERRRRNERESKPHEEMGVKPPAAPGKPSHEEHHNDNRDKKDDNERRHRTWSREE